MNRSQWKHAICVTCYAQQYPGREPCRLREPDVETCCYCATVTRDGIYVRGPITEARYCPSRWQDAPVPDDVAATLLSERPAKPKQPGD